MERAEALSKIKLIMDVDTGVDDAWALLLAARSPEVELLAAGCVAGNVEVDLATLNTLRVLERAGKGDVPVAAGAAAPLSKPLDTAKFVHGEDGLGNTFLPAPAGKPTGEHAADQLVRLARRYPGEIVLCAVGPLTNIALALQRAPELPRLLKRVVIMGGGVGFGNVTPVAEANIHNDPEAAQQVFRAPWDLTMIGLDVTHAVTCSEEQVQELRRSGPLGAFAAAIFGVYLDFMEQATGRRQSPMHDPLAVAVAIDPTLVEAPILPVEVETKGELTRGMTVVDRRVRPGTTGGVRVALRVDSERFMRFFFQRVAG